MVLAQQKIEQCPQDVANLDQACSQMFTLYFDKAVKIIHPDVDKTQRLIVRGMPHEKRFHSCCLAGPNDSEQPPLAFDLTDYS